MNNLHSQPKDVCVTPSFAPSATLKSGGNQPVSITTGDFNGDGKADLAVTNLGSANVGVLLNNGSGSFAAAVTYASGGNFPGSIISGDFNGDGKADLAVTNLFSNNVGVLLNNGSGSFAAAVTYASGGNSPGSIISGDFNGDGKADLALTNLGSANVGVLLNNGSGSFAAVTYASGGNFPGSIISGDFNGDGKADLAVTNGDNIGVLLNNGSGGFAAAVTFGSGGDAPGSIISGDFNGDGKADLAVTNLGSANVGVLLNNGSGSFAAVTYASGGNFPGSIISGDFNGDGKADLAVTNGDNIGVLLNNGSGGFAAAVTFGSGGDAPGSIISGDFNGDGKADLAVTYRDNIGVLLNNCSPFALSVSSFTLVNAATEKEAGDLHDGDVIDLTTLPLNGLNIRANTVPAHVGSVVLQLSGAQTYKRLENGAPYMLFGDQKGNIFGSTLKAGRYTLTATPYSAANGKGNSGTPLTIHFSIDYPAAVTHLTLINSATNHDVKELTDGDVIDLATLPGKKFNIRANTIPAQVGSVVFNLSGTQSLEHTENFAPYALFGDDTHGKYLSGSLPVGSYSLITIPYSESKGNGALGDVFGINFSVVDNSTLLAPVTTATQRKQKSLPETATAKKEASISVQPNPFSSQTTIRFSVPVTSYAALVLYDQIGAERKRLYQGQAEGGREYQLPLESKGLSGGVYLLRLTSGKEMMTHKLVLIR